jgi:hypothetical protein
MKTRRFLILAAILTCGLLAALALMGVAGRQTRAKAPPAAPAGRLAGVLYVDRDAPGPTHDGLSWATAFTEVQTALDAAGAGDEIWVAAGVYYPDYDPAEGRYTGYVTASFVLRPGVALYGGFAGGETGREQRNWRANASVLSGDLDRNDVTDAQGVITTTQYITGANAWTVVMGGGVTWTAGLDGFTLTGGNANGGTPDDEWYAASQTGGGMHLGGVPVLRNLTFAGNAAGNGGGLFNFIGAAPRMENLRFYGNAAQHGGGGLFNTTSSPRLVNVVFENNTAGQGGGVYNSDHSYPRLINVTMSGNTAADGGGIYNFNSGGTLTNCIIWDPANANPGVQIYNQLSTPVIAYSNIQGSRGAGGGWDAALGTDAGGNIDVDPLFVDAAGGNLRPWLGSPVVDAGDNGAVPAEVTTDMDGLRRFADSSIVPDTGKGTAPIVDMGAYEVPGWRPAFTLTIVTDEGWYEPSTGQPAIVLSGGPAEGSVYNLPGAEPIWGQDDAPDSSTLLTRAFTLPADATNIMAIARFVADDGVTLTVNSEYVGNYDAQTWPPPEIRMLDGLQPGRNELQATVYNRPSTAWFEARVQIVYQKTQYVYLPLGLRNK